MIKNILKKFKPSNLKRRARHELHRIKKKYGVEKYLIYNIDFPNNSVLESKKITVTGWVVPLKKSKYILRIKNNNNIKKVKTGIKRFDVAKSYPKLEKRLTLLSGFKSVFEFENGTLEIDVNYGRGYKNIFKKEIKFQTDKLPKDYYNPNLSNNFPEHLNLIQNNKQYFFEEPLNNSFLRSDEDTRLIAFFLPQFYPFKENDMAWGKGFTEWRNVTTAEPRFIGHQQPILPKDLGFYDLRLSSIMEEQINLAKKYGVYAFCFYYYWFSGKKIMEDPLKMFIKNKNFNFNFVICWANENWTKRWDGREEDVIVSQKYLKNDPIKFIKDVESILLDDRYVNEDGKPILIVYRINDLKDPLSFTKTWRNYFKKTHNKDLYLVACLGFEDSDPREFGFDAGLDFNPQSSFHKRSKFLENTYPFVDVGSKLLDINFGGTVADYREIALNEALDNSYTFPVIKCLTPSWDNDSRKKGKGFVFYNSSPDIYSEWLDRLIVSEKESKDSPLIFINAWNEWAEGAIMEPSLHLGHSILNRTVETLSLHSKNNINKINFPKYGISNTYNNKLAIIVHLYYTETWADIKKRLENIKENFDLFVSLSEINKDFDISLKKKNCNIHKFTVPNRGRDVLPFLFILRKIRNADYQYVLKLHSKKSSHRKDGQNWLNDILDNLIPQDNNDIFKALKQSNTGIIGPSNHIVSLKRHMGSNRYILEILLKRIYDKKISDNVISNTQNYPFFGGTMFWFRIDALDKILSLQLLPSDFQSEHGQIDGTTAHALERLFTIVTKIEGRNNYKIKDSEVSKIGKIKDWKYRYAP